MKKVVNVLAIILLLVMCSGLMTCSNGDDDGDATGEAPETTPPLKDTVITIGNLTDSTGPYAVALEVINMALEDTVNYFNEEDLIPGVELKIVSYDGQSDRARDIPGYQWLREKGADFIFTSQLTTSLILKPLVDDDKVVLFAASANMEEISPPGYVFCLGPLINYEVFTLLNWIADNDWDYLTRGPAKIGMASWATSGGQGTADSMEAYAEAHPEQFEWVGGHMPPLGTFTWGPEVQALKDCDYVFPPNPLVNFAKELRDAGSTAKIIGTDVHAVFFGLISDARLWDEIDSMLFVRSSRWWNEEGPMIDLTHNLLSQNHSNTAEAMIRTGNGYIAVVTIYEMLSLIADAVKNAGPEGFNSEVLYDAAQSFSLTIEDVERYSFSETKRYAVNYYTVYEARAEEKDIFRMHSEWLPEVSSP